MFFLVGLPKLISLVSSNVSLLRWLGFRTTGDPVSIPDDELLSVFKDAFDLFFLLDETFSIVKVSQNTLDRLGFEAEALSGKSIDQLLEAHTFRELKQVLDADSNQNNFKFSDFMSCSDTSTVPVELNVIHPETDGNLVEYFLLGRDLSEEINLEENLLRREEQFHQLAHNLDAVFWMRDTDGNALYVSPQYENIWGRSLDAFEEDVNAYTDAIIDEDYDRVREAIPDMKTGNYDIEYRIETPSGERKWIHDRAFPIRNPEGNVYRIGGIAEDITEKRRAQERLEESLAEKEMLLQEIHHRVKNNMQVISSILNLQFGQFDDPQVQKKLKDSLDRIQSMAMTHEMLYQSDDFGLLALSEYLEELGRHIFSVHRSEGSEIDLHFEVDEVKITLEQAVACGLIVTELITNSVQHAFDTSDSGTIEVLFNQQGTRGELIVKDDGSGISSEGRTETNESLGLQLVDSLVESNLEGTYEFQNRDGTEFRMTFELDSLT